jgi:hypothetical protein
LEGASGPDGITQPLNEHTRCGLVPLAHGDVQNQLGVPLDCHERVAVAEVLVVFGTDAFLLFADDPKKGELEGRS